MQRLRGEEAGAAAGKAPHPADRIGHDLEIAAYMIAERRQLDRHRDQPAPPGVIAGVAVPGLKMPAFVVAKDLQGFADRADLDRAIQDHIVRRLQDAVMPVITLEGTPIDIVR